MSHEIRTPMNGVIGMAELLAETDLAREQRQAVTTIIESGRALLTIIDDILDLARLQSGKPTIRSEPFLIGDVMNGVADLLRPLAREKNLDLVVSGPAKPAMLLGDAGRLRQIVLNLAGNAVKFTEKGRVELMLSVVPQGDRARVEIAVRDSGIGIPEDRLEDIFDSFTQADADITRRFGGTGLGLTISRLLASEMGGDIDVQSTPGAGSTFRLTLMLPLALGAESGAADHRATNAGAAPARAAQRILVVEDNATNRTIVGKMLEATGAAVSFVDNGGAAIERYRDWRAEVILMDLSMPGMDGLETTRRIRSCEREDRGPPARIIALTANTFDEDREASLAAGCDAFLTKPISKAALLKAIANPAPAGAEIGL